MTTASSLKAAGAAIIELIGVPFDGFGRPGHQARAAAALRAAGLESVFSGREVATGPDLALPEPNPEHAAGSGLVNEAALLAMTEALHARVADALSAGRFPFVYGADCSVLLGVVPALRDAAGKAGLVLADGHEDTTPLDASDDGEAANMEIGLLTGRAGRTAPESLRARLPALEDGALAMLGPRDQEWRRGLNVASLADSGVWFRAPEAIAADPARAGREAVNHVRAAAPGGWWLHTDLDVLAEDEITTEETLTRGPGGLS